MCKSEKWNEFSDTSEVTVTVYVHNLLGSCKNATWKNFAFNIQALHFFLQDLF